MPAKNNTGAQATAQATGTATPPAASAATETPAATAAPNTPAPEAKGEGSGAAAPAAGAAAAENKEKPPATADDKPVVYDLRLSEGSRLDPARVKEIEAEAKEGKLTNEQAQALIAREEKAAASYAERESKAYEERKAKWPDEIKADAEIGGDNAPKAAELSKRYIDAFAPDDLKQVLESTGLGNHPGLVKMIYRASKATGFGEAEIHPGSGSSGSEKTAAQVLFPNVK